MRYIRDTKAIVDAIYREFVHDGTLLKEKMAALPEDELFGNLILEGGAAILSFLTNTIFERDLLHAKAHDKLHFFTEETYAKHLLIKEFLKGKNAHFTLEEQKVFLQMCDKLNIAEPDALMYFEQLKSELAHS